VRPPGKRREATPEVATHNTIFFLALRYVITVFHRKVFPVPPYQETKKNFGLLDKRVHNAFESM
jgi:hypothetical protein